MTGAAAEITALLIHGGIGSDPMDADRFWVRPGVVGACAERGLAVFAPDRSMLAGSWDAETRHIADAVRGAGFTEPMPVLAGSNGCNIAARLALRHPELVSQLILAWPATAGNERVDAMTRKDLVEKCGLSAEPADALLAGWPLRGSTAEELGTLRTPVAVLRAIENPFHQGVTADALLKTIPGGVEIGSPCPESPRPDFGEYLESFADAVCGAIR